MKKIVLIVLIISICGNIYATVTWNFKKEFKVIEISTNITSSNDPVITVIAKSTVNGSKGYFYFSYGSTDNGYNDDIRNANLSLLQTALVSGKSIKITYHSGELAKVINDISAPNINNYMRIYFVALGN